MSPVVELNVQPDGLPTMLNPELSTGPAQSCASARAVLFARMLFFKVAVPPYTLSRPALLKPRPPPIVFPAMVLLFALNEPALLTPPPRPAVFVLTVLLFRITVPPFGPEQQKFIIPPPESPVVLLLT